MMITATAIGLLALGAQLGVPPQEGTGGRCAPTALEGVAAPDCAVGPAGTPAVADRLDPDAMAWVERVASELTLEEKVAQLVVAYLEGGRPEEGGARWRRGHRLVTEQKVGGFILGVGSAVGTAAWLNELQAASAVPLLVTADLEWGPGTRLRGGTVLPMNMALAAAGGPSLAYEAGRITALEARAAGIHLAFAPVGDVNVNPENPVINTRSYGSDPGLVADRVVAFIEGARSEGLLTVVKHFPGHGDTESDSHLELPILRVDRPRLDRVELPPFRAAIAAGVDGVMSAHLSVPLLDPSPRPRPATLAPQILTDLLRDELGFEGLVVTDGLHMEGVTEHGPTGDVAVAAIAAGADILLIPPDEVDAIDAVVAAVRNGALSEARIDRSVRRVLMAKAAAGLNRDRTTSLAAVLSLIGREEHEAWGRAAAERSITLPRADPRSLPMIVRGRSVLAVLYDDARRHTAGEPFEAALAERGARVQTVRLSRASGPAELDRVRRLARNADRVVFASFSRAVPWKGELGLPDAIAALAGDLARDGAPVLSFGDPYLLRQMPDLRTYMLAWSRADVSQEAAVRALLGEIPVTGRLPIDLPGGHEVGEGVVVPSLPGTTTLPVR